MANKKNDILVKILDDELPNLAKLYEEKAPWAPWMISFVHMCLRWKKTEKYRNNIIFTSPNNCWKEDGTIVAIMKMSRHNIIVFTLQEDCSNLYEGLLKTELIDYSNNRIMFYGIYENHASTVVKSLEDKKIEINAFVPCFIYAMSPEDAKNLNIDECRPTIYTKKLDLSAVKKIAEHWPHKYPGSESYTSAFVEMNGGFGVFLKSTNELVAWALRHSFDQIGFLQTEEKHMKKGYGSLVCKVLAKEMAKDGFWPLATILVENKPSICLFEKMGFRRIGKCTFIPINWGR